MSIKTAVIKLGKTGAVIDKNIYGHFAEHLGRCIYNGIFVGKASPIPNDDGIRIDIIDALKKIKIPVLRWPGGCFADEYHWKDGIGPQSNRKRMINTHWGGVVEDNSFGTHEFFRLCELLETAPYICGNVGSGSVQEMSEWVEYMNFYDESPMANLRRQNGREKPFGLRYFGVGNENWGCGGRMRAEHYADLYRNYSTYAHNYGENKLYLVAAGPRGANYHWMEVMMREAGCLMNGIGLHYYTRVGDKVITVKHEDGNEVYLRDELRSRRSATQFDESDWFGIIKAAWFTDELVARHSDIMDRYDPQKRVALIVDEWGTWFDSEPDTNPGFLYQQNTLRDAVSGAISLNIFNNHADRVRMTNIAQTVNVLQAMVLTEGEQMILTPSYYVFDLFTPHQDATLIQSTVETSEYAFDCETVPGLSVSTSLASDRTILMTIVNPDPNSDLQARVDLGSYMPTKATGRILTSANMNDFNDFTDSDKVCPRAYAGASFESGTLSLHLPKMSVVAVELR